MKTLVTGGCGFIGSAVVAEWRSRGQDVYVIDNNSFGTRDKINIADANFFHVDILDRPAVHDVLMTVKPEAVLHLAAVHFIPHCNKYPFESANVNLIGTANVLDASRQCSSVRRMFFASTAAVYPIVETAIPETHPIGPMDIYGLSKAVGERLCHEFYLESRIPTVICRFFNAFGPNETNPHLIPEIVRQLGTGQRTLRLGNLEPKRDFIHTSDMADAIARLVDNSNAGCETFNLGSGTEYSVQEIIDEFSRQLGEPITIESDPKKLRAVDRLHLLADIKKIREHTGWRPRHTLAVGIGQLLGKETM